jgi:Ribbon-helix-helix protein, copG family
MELNRYVAHLGREFATLAEAGGEESRALVERLAGPLESAIRMTLLDTLSAAADEISRDLAPGSVELRLRGRDPSFVVTTPPGEPGEPGESVGVAPQPDSTTSGDAGDSARLLAEDGPAARINVRLPEQLKAAVEEAAAREGRSVNAWLVRAAAAAVQPDRDQRPEPRGSSKRTKQGITGWVR